MLKDKMNIDGEKNAQINTAAKKISTQGWHQVMIMESKKVLHHIYIFFFYIHYHDFTVLLWSLLELLLMQELF